jgi:hypothetical protein
MGCQWKMLPIDKDSTGPTFNLSNLTAPRELLYDCSFYATFKLDYNNHEYSF